MAVSQFVVSKKLLSPRERRPSSTTHTATWPPGQSKPERKTTQSAKTSPKSKHVPANERYICGNGESDALISSTLQFQDRGDCQSCRRKDLDYQKLLDDFKCLQVTTKEKESPKQNIVSNHVTGDAEMTIDHQYNYFGLSPDGCEASLKNDVSTMGKEVKTNKASIDGNTRQIKNMEAQIRELQLVKHKMTRQLKTDGDLEQKRIQDVENEIKELKRRIKLLEHRIERYKQQVKLLTSQNKELVIELTRAREELRKYESGLLHSGKELYVACKNGDEDGVKRILDEGVDNINYVNGGFEETSVIAACEVGNERCVRMLKAAGADLERPDKSGETPLIRASIKGHDQCVALLLGSRVNTQHRDGLGKTASDYAVTYCHPKCVELLPK